MRPNYPVIRIAAIMVTQRSSDCFHWFLPKGVKPLCRQLGQGNMTLAPIALVCALLSQAAAQKPADNAYWTPVPESKVPEKVLQEFKDWKPRKFFKLNYKAFVARLKAIPVDSEERHTILLPTMEGGEKQFSIRKTRVTSNVAKPFFAFDGKSDRLSETYSVRLTVWGFQNFSYLLKSGERIQGKCTENIDSNSQSALFVVTVIRDLTG